MAPESSRRNRFSGGARARFTPSHTAPSAHGAVEGDDHVGVVGQRGRHPVTGTDPEVLQGVGGAVGLGVELDVGQPPGAGDERLAVGVLGQRPLEHAGDRRRRGPHGG